MEPPVRSYNSNSSGQPRRRASTSKGNKRPSDAPVRASTRKTRSDPPARKAVVSTLPNLPDAEQTAAEAMPEPASFAEVIAEQPASPETAGAGPVVTIADFEDIFARFQTPLINFIFRLVGNREQACDLTQDVFVKAYRALSTGTTIQAAALSSWLYRIASNTATDALRRRRLISWLPLSLFNEDRGVGAGMPGMEANGTNQPGPSEEALASAANAFTSGYDGGRFEQRVADREIVESVLKRLPPKYAACLLLYEHEGFSCAEIAEVLNVSPSAVKMRLMRARERFISLYRQEVNGQ
jgi:RNA polymerase sigma-70 factor, ECF subfamily